MLTSRNYIEKIIGTWHFCHKANLSDISDLNSSFPFFSSVIDKFFPNKYTYESQVNFYKRWAGMDDKEFNLIPNIQVKNQSGLNLNTIKSNRYIFASFHLGSYRQINNFLIHKNIPFFLLTDKNFIDTQENSVKETYNKAHLYFQHSNYEDLIILNAEDAKVLFQIKKEFAKNKSLVVYIDGNTGIDVYFAHPYHSWERGSNENLNGLIRQYFPKKMDFDTITDEQIKQVETKINNRPRKRYGFISPVDRMNNLLFNGAFIT